MTIWCYDKKGRRMNIIQDSDELIHRYAHKLNYDPNDSLFLRYYRNRTGWQLFPRHCPHPEDDEYESGYPYRLVTQCKLQDCWELFNQPGFREAESMAWTILDAAKPEDKDKVRMKNYFFKFLKQYDERR